MSWYRMANKESYTKEMEEFYNKRTERHINLVGKYCKKIAKFDPNRFGELIERAKVHDDSKYGDKEKVPYIFITWKYKCKDEGVPFSPSEEMEERINGATEHHVRSNSHHPEYWDKSKSSSSKVVDATDMPDIDLAEMVADWLAMSDEKKTNAIDWADNNVNIRWKFSDHQVNLIYELLNEFCK